MTTMLEKMARRIAAADGERAEATPRYISLARAALLGARDPSNAVLDAGSDRYSGMGPGKTAVVWQAVVDAILNESENTA